MQSSRQLFDRLLVVPSLPLPLFILETLEEIDNRPSQAAFGQPP
jgi:hypothetical protein